MAAKDEEIGYHKGALTTLAKERTELKRILDIVEQLDPKVTDESVTFRFEFSLSLDCSLEQSLFSFSTI